VENDELIMRNLLKSAYEPKNKDWTTANKIAENGGEPTL